MVDGPSPGANTSVNNPVALAVDLYGGVTATAPDKAQALMTGVFADADGARRNLRQAYDYLDRYALSPRIASIGWDLGGSWALQTGLLFPDELDAVVMFYGQVVRDRSELSKLKMPILGFFGSEDKTILVRDVQDFREMLRDLGKNAEIRIMIGADHGFTDSTGARYHQRSAAEAWTATLEFLRRNLKLAESAR